MDLPSSVDAEFGTTTTTAGAQRNDPIFLQGFIQQKDKSLDRLR